MQIAVLPAERHALAEPGWIALPEAKGLILLLFLMQDESVRFV